MQTGNARGHGWSRHMSKLRTFPCGPATGIGARELSGDSERMSARLYGSMLADLNCVGLGGPHLYAKGSDFVPKGVQLGRAIGQGFGLHAIFC